ncbi:MAG TPA: DUF1819 family protein [Pyrinomonadaceae bacterium]|nr:DUF1819 family protein [Pyrinomonadaceae bacterium]
MQSRYNAEIVAGALLPNESRTIAKLILDGVSQDEFKRLLMVENNLQKRSPGTALRKANLVTKRFNIVNEELLRIVANGSRQAQMQALLIAAIKHNKLIGDYLLRVVKEKWRVFETILKPNDWENFLLECEQLDETVSLWKVTTRYKLGQVVKKCLVEAGYLESATNPVITPVLLLPEIKTYLIKNNEDYVLECMDIFI